MFITVQWLFRTNTHCFSTFILLLLYRLLPTLILFPQEKYSGPRLQDRYKNRVTKNSGKKLTISFPSAFWEICTMPILITLSSSLWSTVHFNSFVFSAIDTHPCDWIEKFLGRADLTVIDSGLIFILTMHVPENITIKTIKQLAFFGPSKEQSRLQHGIQQHIFTSRF